MIWSSPRFSRLYPEKSVKAFYTLKLHKDFGPNSMVDIVKLMAQNCISCRRICLKSLKKIKD
ncbi:hypothetical protein HanLR1_Chr08g0280341 [Helianthus annuus]|nr:hypothetical protein HanHA89_Chr08g0298791 [Helianthus annuus]KAJ0719320.1 hypothetical protein HanLR1_Chr08g0280341 [Helianthus annuus]